MCTNTNDSTYLKKAWLNLVPSSSVLKLYYLEILIIYTYMRLRITAVQVGTPALTNFWLALLHRGTLSSIYIYIYIYIYIAPSFIMFFSARKSAAGACLRDVIAMMIMWILMFCCLLLFAHVKLIPRKQMLVFLTGHRHLFFLI